MAGKEATADSHPVTARNQPERSCRDAARLSVVYSLVFAVALASAIVPAAEIPTSSASPVIRASGHTIYRWQIDDAQASMLEGGCVLHHGRDEIKAERILIVSDGPRGRVRNRLVIEGRIRPDGTREPTPRTATWTTAKEPSVQAPNYRGRPPQRPFLLEYLPLDSIESVAPLQPRPVEGVAAQAIRDQAIGDQQSQDVPAVAQVQFAQPVPDPGVTTPGATDWMSGPENPFFAPSSVNCVTSG